MRYEPFGVCVLARRGTMRGQCSITIEYSFFLSTTGDQQRQMSFAQPGLQLDCPPFLNQLHEYCEMWIIVSCVLQHIEQVSLISNLWLDRIQRNAFLSQNKNHIQNTSCSNSTAINEISSNSNNNEK